MSGLRVVWPAKEALIENYGDAGFGSASQTLQGKLFADRCGSPRCDDMFL